MFGRSNRKNHESWRGCCCAISFTTKALVFLKHQSFSWVCFRSSRALRGPLITFHFSPFSSLQLPRLSLLTTPITSILEPLNISLPQQSTSLLLDPPISAGIEHTGSALEVDALLERQRKLEEGLSSGAGGNNDFSTISRGLKRSREENEKSGKQREIWKVWGKGRVERGDELVSSFVFDRETSSDLNWESLFFRTFFWPFLFDWTLVLKQLSKLADYTSVTITSIQSKSVPSSSSSVRHVEMKGSLLHFGDFRATFEVVEPTIDQPVTETISFRTASGLGPRMRNLKMDLPQTARKVLEAEGHLEQWVRAHMKTQERTQTDLLFPSPFLNEKTVYSPPLLFQLSSSPWELFIHQPSGDEIYSRFFINLFHHSLLIFQRI